MARLHYKSSFSPVELPRSLGHDAKSITVAYLYTHLRHYIPEIKCSNQGAEGWKTATDHALLDPFLGKFASLCLGSFWLLH